MRDKRKDIRLLWFNLATDADDPILGFTTSWIRAIAERIEFIHVITMRAGRVDVPGNVRVYSVGKEKNYSEPRRAIEFYRCLFRILQEGRIDACFSHMIPIFTVLAGPVLKAKGIPLIAWYAHRQVSMTLKLAHHLSDRIVTSSETAYRYHGDKLMVVGQGIDTDLFSPDGMHCERRPYLLSVGRLSPIKDPITLVKAVQLLRNRGFDIECSLVGNASERDHDYAVAVREKVEEWGLDGIVRFAGSVSGGRVVDSYRNCFAHINLCPTGALDKAALEAMACGKPSIVANEGFRPTLGPWANRLLFRHGDPYDLSLKLESVLRLSRDEHEEMGRALRRSVVQHHSLRGLGDKIVGICENLREQVKVPLGVLWQEVRQGKGIARILQNRVFERWHGEVNGMVLDLACGKNPSYWRALRLQKNPSVRLIGVESNLSLQPTIVADLTREFPFKDGVADVVIISSFLYVMEDPRALLQEARRVLKRGGLLLLTAPLIYPHHPEPTDYWRFTEDSLRLLLRDTGFPESTVVPVGGRWTAAAYLLSPFLRPRRLAPILPYWLCMKLDRWTEKRFQIPKCPIAYVVKARATP